jgi:hypothetical protein
MTVSSAARRDQQSSPEAALRAEVGDLLVIDEGGGAGVPRIGEIVGTPSPDGSPPYLVRWLAGEYESTIMPGPRARIERRRQAGPRSGGRNRPGAIAG